MGIYANIDKAVFKGYLPGGSAPQTSQPSTPVIAPTKSTTPNIQPTVPAMTITLPSGNTISPKPVQTSPSTGGGGYVSPSPSGGSSGGGSNYTAPTSSGYIGQPVSQQPSSTLQQINTPTSNAFTSYLPESKSLSTQLKPAEKSISTLKDYGYVKPYTQSFLESSKESFSNLMKGDFENTFTPFGKSGTAVGLLSASPLISSISYGIQGKTPFDIKSDIRKKVVKSTGNEYFNYPSGPIREAKIAEDISGSISTKAQSDYNTMFTNLQGQVNNGLDIKNAESLLSDYGKALEKESSNQFKTSFDFKLSEMSKGQKVIDVGSRGLTSTGRIVEVAGPIAVDIGVMTLVPGGGTIIGGKEFLVGASKNDNFRTVLGAGFVTGGAIARASKIPYEVSVMKATREIGQKGFTFGEVQVQGINKDLSLVKGFREAGGLRQEIEVSGFVFKDSETFLQPGSQYNIKTAGIIKNEYANLGRTDIKFIGGQTGQIGAKGFTLPVGESNVMATFGKGTLVKEFESSAYGKLGISKESLSKQFNSNIQKSTNEFTSDYFMGVTKDLGKNTLITRSGKISSMELNPTREIDIMSIEANKRNIKPSKYLDILESKGEAMVLRLSPEEYKSIDIAGFKLDSSAKAFYVNPKFSNLPETKGLFVLRNDAGEREIGHELAHFFTEGKFAKADIGKSYWNKPSEKYAIKMQDIYAEKGIRYQGFENGFKLNTNKITETREGLLVKTNLKDFTITKLIKQSKFETTFDISTSNKGTDLGLKQLIKQEPKSSKGFLTTSTVQQFKSELRPMVKLQSKSFTSQVSSGLKLESVKSSSQFGGQALTGLKSKERFVSPSSSFSSSISKSDTSFKASNLPKVELSNLPKQDQPQISRLVTSQSFEFKSPELNKETFRNITPTFETGFKINPTGFSGTPFFGTLPSLGGESVGRRTYKRKKKKKTKIAPSFTAEVFNLRGPLPKSGQFGITPFQLRRIPKGGRNTYETKF